MPVLGTSRSSRMEKLHVVLKLQHQSKFQDAVDEIKELDVAHDHAVKGVLVAADPSHMAH